VYHPRMTKTAKSASTPAVATAASAVTPAPKMAPKTDAAVKTEKAVKPVAVKAAKSAASPPASPPAEAVEAVEGAEAVVPAVDHIAEMATLLVSILSQVKEAQAKLKIIVKESDKMKKTIDKAEKKRAKARTSPNGFAKPAKISNEMCDFLGVDRGTELSRTEVTRRITAYIKTNNLVNPKNRREIKPDAKLKKVLEVGPNDDVTYFVLQRYLSKHFIKTPAVVATA